jgi:hypothetical protein
MLLCKIALIVLSLWGIGAAVIVSVNCGPEHLWHPQGDATCNGDVSAPCFVYTCIPLTIAIDKMADRHNPGWCYRDRYVRYCGLVGWPAADDSQEQVRSMRCLCLETCVSIACLSLRPVLADTYAVLSSWRSSTTALTTMYSTLPTRMSRSPISLYGNKSIYAILYYRSLGHSARPSSTASIPHH